MSDVSRMDEVIKSYVADKEFMGSVLVAQNGKVLLSKGYGYANLEWEVPNSPTAKFHLGSLTKQFTAVAILLLEEKGLLQVIDAINKYLPDAPVTWHDITIFNLLTHTHGIPNYTGLPEYASITTIKKTPAELIALFRDKPLDFEPGSKYEYNNSGYILLGSIIEKLSGQSYEDFIVDHIFKPLGMNDSGYDSNLSIIPQRVSGYTKESDGIWNANFLDMSQPYAAGSLYSTVLDLLTWHSKLFGVKILSPISLQKMITPFKEGYGFGVEIKCIDDYNVIMHIGGINGFNTALIYCQKTQVSVIVLSNLNTVGYVYDIGFMSQNIALKMVKLAHGNPVILSCERKEAIVSDKTLSKYVGTYDIKPMMNLAISLENGRLMAQFNEQQKIQLFSESETVFFGKTPDIQIDFSENKQNKISYLNLYQSGYSLRGHRI